MFGATVALQRNIAVFAFLQSFGKNYIPNFIYFQPFGPSLGFYQRLSFAFFRVFFWTVLFPALPFCAFANSTGQVFAPPPFRGSGFRLHCCWLRPFDWLRDLRHQQRYRAPPWRRRLLGALQKLTCRFFWYSICKIEILRGIL